MAAWDAPATSDPSVMAAVAAMASSVSTASTSATNAASSASAAASSATSAQNSENLAAQYASYTQNAITSAMTAMQMQHPNWNATTNSPTLTSGTGTAGYFYVVGTAGSTNLDGTTTWLVNDIAFFDGTIWRRIAASGQTSIASTSITDSTSAGRTLLTAATVAAQRIAMLVDQITSVSDANQTITASMRTVAWTSISAARTATLPAVSTMNPGEPFLIMDASGSASATNTITIQSAGSDTINGGSSVTINSARGAVIVVAPASGANWIAISIGSPSFGTTSSPGILQGGIGTRITSGVLDVGRSVRVRQSVNGSPVDGNGMPNYIVTAASLSSYATSGISTGGARLVVSAANGWDDLGANDYVFTATNNITWPTLTASSTLYLYVNASTGVTGFTPLQPSYIWGGSPSSINGQFTFIISQMMGYMGNGSSAVATPLVFIGEVTTSGSAVATATAYANNGVSQSTWITTIPGGAGATSYIHNLGCQPYMAEVLIRCNSSDDGYAPGDIVTAFSAYIVGVYTTMTKVPVSSTRLTSTMSQTGAMILPNKTTGTPAGLTTSKWDYSFYVMRGW